MKHRLAGVVAVYEAPRDLPDLRPGSLQLDARLQASLSYKTQEPSEPCARRAREDLVEEDETVKSSAAGEVEAPNVEGSLRGGGYAERDAGAAGGEHRQGVRQHFAADRLQDQVVWAVLLRSGGAVPVHHLVRARFPHQSLAVPLPDNARHAGPGDPGEPAGEEADPSRGAGYQDVLAEQPARLLQGVEGREARDGQRRRL